MKIFLPFLFCSASVLAAPKFINSSPNFSTSMQINTRALCTTAKSTLAYLDKGASYDPAVIHEGKVIKIPVQKVKATLQFICAHQQQLNDPAFIQQHFTFLRWYPDLTEVKVLASQKTALKKLTKRYDLDDQVLCTSSESK